MDFLGIDKSIKGKVSVMIPTYNRKELLKEALESVIKQTYRPIECVIVDDGSTDNSREVISDFKDYNDESFQIKYIYQENSGAQVARNLGTLNCTGEFIQYLDSDDLLDSQKIEKQVDILIKNPDLDGTFGDFRKGVPENNKLQIAFESENLFEQFLIKFCAPPVSVLLRREYVNKIGDWDISLKRFQDIDFHIRGLLMGGKYKYVSMETGLWRTHAEERISERGDLKDVFIYFDKWENILEPKKLFSTSIKKYFADFYFLMAANNKVNTNYERILALKNAVRLNPEISFFNTSKMKFLRKFVGLESAIKMWLSRSNKNQKQLN